MNNKRPSDREEVETAVPYLWNAFSTLGRVHAMKAFGNTHCYDYLRAAERLAGKERKIQRHVQ